VVDAGVLGSRLPAEYARLDVAAGVTLTPAS
jgi:hypothetical protein